MSNIKCFASRTILNTILSIGQHHIEPPGARIILELAITGSPQADNHITNYMISAHFRDTLCGEGKDIVTIMSTPSSHGVRWAPSRTAPT